MKTLKKFREDLATLTGVLLLCFTICFNSFCASTKMDPKQRLESLLKSAKNSYATQQADSAILFARKALKLATDNKLAEKELESYRILGAAYLFKKDYLTADVNYNKALKIAKDLNDEHWQSDLYNKLGILRENEGKLKEAVSFFLASVDHAKKSNNFESATRSYEGISLIYGRLGLPDKQLEYIRKSTELVYSHPEITPISRLLVYGTASQEYIRLAEGKKSAFADSAKHYADLSIETANKYKLTFRLPAAYSVLSAYHLIHGNTVMARDYSLRVLEMKQFTNAKLLTNVYYRLGEIALKKEDRTEAFAAVDSVKQIVRDFKLSDLYHFYNYAWKIYKHFGEYELATEALENRHEVNLKINAEQLRKDITELETKYKSALKDAEIAQLSDEKEIRDLQISKQKSQITTLIGIALLLIILGVLIFFVVRQKLIKKEFQKLENDLKLNRSRMNPHMFFNTLSTLQHRIASTENVLTASDLLAKHAAIMRKTLESTFNEFITLEEEIEYLEMYVDVVSSVSSKPFQFSIVVDEEIDDYSAIMVPSLLIQPFIENAIEHGFSGIEYDGILTVKFKISDDQLIIEILDNGKGSSAVNANPQPQKISRAKTITKERLNLLQRKFDKTFELHENMSQKGTVIELNISLDIPLNIE